MAEVETFRQLVSWSGNSSESLALQCDLIYGDVLGQRFPQWGGGVLSSWPFLLQLLKIDLKKKKKKVVTSLLSSCITNKLGVLNCKNTDLVVGRGCEQWCDCLHNRANPQLASQEQQAEPLEPCTCICTCAVDLLYSSTNENTLKEDNQSFIDDPVPFFKSS